MQLLQCRDGLQVSEWSSFFLCPGFGLRLELIQACKPNQHISCQRITLFCIVLLDYVTHCAVQATLFK